MELRPLSKENYRDAKNLFKRTFKIPYADFIVSWNERSTPDSFSIFYENRFIGFVIASYHRSSGSNMYIDYIALDPEYRGNGIGSTLLRMLVEKCYRENRSVHLYPERKDILSWYARHGFNQTINGHYVFHSYSTRKQHIHHKALGF